MKRCPAAEGVVIASSCDVAISRTSTTLKPKRGKSGIEPSKSFRDCALNRARNLPARERAALSQRSQTRAMAARRDGSSGLRASRTTRVVTKGPDRPLDEPLWVEIEIDETAPYTIAQALPEADDPPGRDGKRIGRLSGNSLQSRAQCRKDWLSVRLRALVSPSDAGANDARMTQPPLRLWPIRGLSW
jgi:hypothetical protein